MRLSPVQSLTMALCMLFLFPGGLHLCVHADCFIVGIEVLPEDLEQPPVVAESVASEWTSTIGLRSPHGWARVRMDVAPEGLKQPPAVADSMASEWTSTIGLRSPHDWARVRMDVDPEGLKQPPAVADSMASEWTSTIGLRSPHGWVRIKMAVAPEGLKQPPVGTESIASELHGPLRRLWDHLVQLDRTWHLCRAWQTMWLLHTVSIALRLWRNVKRSQGQASGQTAATATGPGRLGRHTVSKYELLCLMEAKITLLVRCLRHTHRLRLKELRHQYSRRVAQEKGWQPAEGSWG
ncbi:uncharacterized protein LOC115349058 [Aquila chrysaetos chrysaetos]|nr:uncharacterized protein LOC115349058 [Aquila chrysaetos chrysaetos]